MDHPINFTARQVLAVLGGTMTQVRVPMRPQPFYDNKGYLWWMHSKYSGSAAIDPVGSPSSSWKCPLGQPGDSMWIRETWCEVPWVHDLSGEVHTALLFKADRPGANEFDPGMDRWRSPVHMPRWASRLTLEITRVRVQRVQEIDEEDAIAEGAPPLMVPPDGGSCPYCEGFRAFWDSTHGKKPGLAWEGNPWVWAIGFKRKEA